MKTLLTVFAGAALIVGCGFDRKENSSGQDIGSAQKLPTEFRYKISEPDSVFELKPQLDEISGLQWWDENTLLAVSDEKGVVYLLDSSNGNIKDSVEFESKGDFEGICRRNDEVFVLKSNGEIFQLIQFGASGFKEAKEIETGLNFDCEGIVYSDSEDRFLIICKDTLAAEGRPIFATSLRENETPEKRYAVSVKHLEDSLITNSFDEVAYAIANALSSKDHAGILGPSGLAINPKDQKIYLLSGTSSLLIILSAEGQFETAVPLPIDLLPQPEGIAFSPMGDLYIASEKANQQHGVIVKFQYNE